MRFFAYGKFLEKVILHVKIKRYCTLTDVNSLKEEYLTLNTQK